MRLQEVPGFESLDVAIETGLPGAVVAAVAFELTPPVSSKSTLLPVVAFVCKRHRKDFVLIHIKLVAFGRNEEAHWSHRGLIDVFHPLV